jgi:alpha-L-fucosidase 2
MPSRRNLLHGSFGALAALALPGDVRAAGDGGAEADHPNMLWYQRPAREWTEALPVGNGRIGAMVFGCVGQERLQLNEDTLWAGGPYDPVNPGAAGALAEVRRLIFADRWAEAEALANASLMARPIAQMPYQTVGDLMIDMSGTADFSDYRRALDLDAAIATTRFRAGATEFRREVVASPADQVIAVRLSADRPGPIDANVWLRTPQPGAVVQAEANGTLVLTARNPAAHGIAGALRFEARAHVSQSGGRIEEGNDRVRVRGADEVVILIAMATSYRRYDDVNGDPAAATREQIVQARRRSFAEIAARTAEEHRRLFRRVAVDLGRTAAAHRPTDERIRTSETADDPALAALYFQYGRYLLIASSRPGSQPANLQGLWNDSTDPPWGSKYTININTEMNYWPAEPTGLEECVAPLVAMVRDLAETGARTAREMYGARGWVVHHNTDLWRATAPVDGARWGLWPTGGAWLCLHLWDHYDYGRDEAYLRSVYPLLRGAAQFFLDTLQRDPRTGLLVTNPSLSPENVHPQGASLCAGPAMDMQILRDLFDRTARAATVLALDAELVADLVAARQSLAPDQVGRNGQLQEWQLDWDDSAPEPDHRHVSHLYGLFPSDQISFDETPALARAARRSLELRGDESTGWATSWRANLWARLRDGEHAHAILRFLLGPERTYPNMFDAHPPFQIDGNFGGTRAIVEMLMQSRGDSILLLPALPSAWPTGSISGLRARGACRIDLSWRGGTLESATLSGRMKGERRVRFGDREVAVPIVPGRPVRLRGPELELA